MECLVSSPGGNGQRQQAPHLLEEEYNLDDGLLVGGLVNALRRRVAWVAQLLKVIAPIVTNANHLLRQSIYRLGGICRHRGDYRPLTAR
jgi:alpha-L-arabinofuranosidase